MSAAHTWSRLMCPQCDGEMEHKAQTVVQQEQIVGQHDHYVCARCDGRHALVIHSRPGEPVDAEDGRSSVERTVARRGSWFPSDA